MSTFERRERGVGVIKKECTGCSTTHETYFLLGDTHRPKLMECSECSELFYYTEDCVNYIRPIEDQIREKRCPTCKASLKNTLVKYRPEKHCSQCGSDKMVVVQESNHEYRMFFDLYSDSISS